MKRRDLLKGASAATGLGAASFGAGLSGCAPALQPQSGIATGGSSLDEAPLPSAEEIARVVREMDERLAWIDHHDARGKLFGGVAVGSTTDTVEREQKVKLFRQTMRTLYVTGRFMDLPDEIKMHPEVQARMWQAQPDMDEAVLGMTDLLASMTPDDHAALQATLREQPSLIEGLASMMDETAKEDGMPVRRRAGIRTTTLALADRMAKQSPRLVIDPYVRRVRRVQSRPIPRNGAARAMIARVGEEAYWQQEKRLTDIALRWQRHLAQATAAGGLAGPGPLVAPPATTRAEAGTAGSLASVTAASADAQKTPPSPSEGRVASSSATAPVATPPRAASPQAVHQATGSEPTKSSAAAPARPGEGTMRVGGYLMGFAAGSFVLGVIFAGLNSLFEADVFLGAALVFGVTIGPILLIAGLITLIVGAIIKASSSPK